MGTVSKCAVAGCGGVPTVLAQAQEQPLGIAVDNVAVYWINYISTVMKVAK
jgi:hypothetical protein